MREIKFREWDGLRYFHVNIDSDDKVFQLSTGLKDKKKREIYEGDLCRGTVASNVDYVVEGKIGFYNGCFTLGNYNLWDFIDLEIIGNVFKSPKSIKL